MSAKSAPVAAPEETVREEVEQERNDASLASGQRELADAIDSPGEVEIQNDAIGRLTPPARRQVAERLRQSERLPAGLRLRLAELIEAQDSAESIEAAVRAVEEALPGALRIGGQELRRPEHPLGETFFQREAGELSDDEAERIAREQLSRAGLLRGQRVRVGD